MLDNTANNKRIAKNTLFLSIRMGLVLIGTLYLTRVVLHVLGIENYGIYNVVCGFVAMFSFLNTTLAGGINRFYNFELGKKGNVTTVYNTALVIQFIIALALLILLETIGLWYVNTKLVIPIERLNTARAIFHFSVFSLVLTVLQTPFSAAILAYERMNYYAIVSIVDVFLKLGIAILIQFTAGDKLLLYGLLMAAIALLDFLMYYVYCKRLLKELKLKFYLNIELFKSMLSFSGWLLFNTIAYTARSQGSNLVLNYFFGPIVNAAYGITNQISGALDSFSGNISVASRPQLVQSYSSGDTIRTKNLTFSMSKIMYILILMLFVPLFLNIEYILHIWLGDNIPNYTIPFTCYMLIVKLIDSLNPSITTVLMATGKMKKYMLWSSIIICSIIPLSIFSFKLGYDPVSIFIIMAILTFINQCASMIILSQEFEGIRIKEYVKDVILPCFFQTSCVIIVPLIINFTMEQSMFRLVLSCLTSLCCTLIAAYFVCLNKSEKFLVNNLIRKIANKFQSN